MKQTKVRTIRIPVELDTRIKLLADKRLWSINKWINNALTQQSRPK
jgi:predicted HicB family RNase H-like nuclease